MSTYSLFILQKPSIYGMTGPKKGRELETLAGLDSAARTTGEKYLRFAENRLR
jgi:hypothetical protein